jgi:hypothetical protein
MSLFEFIAGMISVIFALAVAQLFIGVAELAQHRGKVRPFLPHAVWNVNLFLLTFVHWWSLWTFRDLSWNFGMFFFSLLGPSLMFFAASVINPRVRSEGVIDLTAHFLAIRRLFMVVFIAMMVLFTLDGPMFGTEPHFNTLRVAQMSVVGSAAWGFASKSRSLHTAISLLVLLALGAVVIIRFFPGGGNG